MIRRLLRRNWTRYHMVCGGNVTPVHPTIEQAMRDEFFCEGCNNHYIPFADTVQLTADRRINR